MRPRGRDAERLQGQNRCYRHSGIASFGASCTRPLTRLRWSRREVDLEARPSAYMDLALALAREAAADGEIPVGAVLATPDGRTFAGRNRIESGSPLGHAELEALEAALASEGRHGLAAATLYATLEPCIMCLGAMVHARIGGLVYACAEPRFGGVSLLQALWREGRYPHRFPIARGEREEEARALLQAFFERRRAGGEEYP